MSYSLSITKSIYPLIILYSGEIRKEDILNNIEYDNCILKNLATIKLEFSNSPEEKCILEPLLERENLIYHLHLNKQESNILGPLYAFNLDEYKLLFYLHCDAIFKANNDKVFNTITLTEEAVIYAPGVYNGKLHDSHYCIIRPNKKIWEDCWKIKNKKLTCRNLNFDNFINNFLSEDLKIQKLDLGIDNTTYWHNYGHIKYWKCFPKADFKKILKLKDKDNVIKFMNDYIALCYRNMDKQKQLALSPVRKETFNEYIKLNNLEASWKQY